MIQCSKCGKKKKVQRLPEGRMAWRCSACRKPKTPAAKAEVRCHICADSVFLRESKIDKSDYYVCGPCMKQGRHRVERLGVQRAKRILELGLQQDREEQSDG